MFRSIVLAGALLSAGAVSAQEVAISGKDFLSGAGDAKIAELARQAAASGKTIVITAPPYWQDKAAAKVHSGAANASVRMSDAFFENVMVKVEDGKAAPKAVEPVAKPVAPKAEAKPEPKPEAKPEPKAESRPTPPVRKAEEAPPPPAPAPVEAPPPPPVEVKPEPVAAPPPPAPVPVAAPPAPAPAVAAKPAADPNDAIKKRFEQNLNGGQPADGSLTAAQLQKDDLVYANGSVLAVVRRFGPRNQLFWLNGDLNLERTELVVTGPDRYRVSEPIRNVANPTLRGGGSSKGAAKFVAAVPAAKSPARVALEKQYNDGRDITGTLQPTELHSGDLVYTTEGAAVVIRRSSVGMERFWFVGELDLHQTGLQLQGNAIRVLTDTIK